MVTGGFDGSYLDTTEVYDNHWRTVAGKLPFVMGYMRATTLSNRVLLFGNHYVLVLRTHLIVCNFLNILGGYFDYYRKTILEYHHMTEEWQEIGGMKEARAGHAVTVVKWQDYAKWCTTYT